LLKKISLVAVIFPKITAEFEFGTEETRLERIEPYTIIELPASTLKSPVIIKSP
jgi:hypothetical protein